MQNKKKVLMAVCNFFTNDNRVFRAADALAANGYEVLLLTYHRDDLKEHETLGHGFHLHRIPLKAKINKPARFANLLKYIDFKRKAKKIAADYQPDIVHCNDYSTLFLGIYCKQKYGSKLVYDDHEYFQDLNYLHRYPMAVRKYIARYERNTIKQWIDKMIVVSPGIAEAYEKLTTKKPEVVMNITDRAVISEETPRNDEFNTYNDYLTGLKKEGKELLLYIGKNFVRGRGMDFTIKLLKHLPENYFLIIFGCSNDREINQLRTIFKERGVDDRIKAFKFVEFSNLYHLKDHFSYGLSLIEPIYFSYNYSLPNKLFEYIMMGIPVIASDIPEQKRVVEQYGIGLIADLKTPELTARQLQETGDNTFDGMEKARKELTWENEKQKLLKIYTELL